jgi:Ca-activated chloride channel family protein
MLQLLPDVFQRTDTWHAANRRNAAILSPRAALFILVFLTCFVFNMLAAPVVAQFSSGVGLVEVYATVVDREGSPVQNLTAADFTVLENGVPQTLQVFTPGDLPLSLAIGVDRSFSVSRDRLRMAVVGAQELLGKLRPDDRVTLLAIGSEVETLTPLSNDHRAAYFALSGLEPWGTTPLFDATVSALTAIQPASGRRALILLSDGSDRYSESTAAQVIEAARRRDVLVYPVALQRAAPPIFAELASVTGGRSVAARDGRALSVALSAIATELRHQYLIGYAPAGAAASSPGWRSITVRVNDPSLRVRARDGYYADR